MRGGGSRPPLLLRGPGRGEFRGQGSAAFSSVLLSSIQQPPWAKYLGAFHEISGVILFDKDNFAASSVQGRDSDRKCRYVERDTRRRTTIQGFSQRV